MAGMFYSLQEVSQKLGKTEEEVKEIVKTGRLREFRDGPNLLFKVDEVEALMADTSIMASKESSTGTEEPETDNDWVPEATEPTEAIAEDGELTGADTAIAGDGIDVLGGTDSGYQLADDTKGETSAASGEEASLEEIEEDVNLDTFGSGSGLLDLSLQADDTSLGGILDEIYTPEGDESKKAGGSGSAMEVAAEAEQMLAEDEIAATQLGMEGSAARAYIEPEPDMLSNALGIMLFLPLLVIVYTIIVTIAGFNDVIILGKIQGMIWYIMLAAAIVAFLIVGAASVFTGKSDKVSKKKKAKKAKKTKKAKKAPPPVSEPEGETK